jgi:acetyl-CoA C-acetyltransferase
VNALGLDDSKPLTVTGGLTFGGGPLNNYVMHSIARMVELSREDVDGVGLVTANGGYLTKHAFGIYSATPPAFDFRFEDVQPAVDQAPTRELATEFSGSASVESYTVMYKGDQPAMGHLALRTESGARAWANVQDTGDLAAMTTEECCGRAVSVNADSLATFA